MHQIRATLKGVVRRGAYEMQFDRASAKKGPRTPMIVVVLAQSKGGVGKTTLAVNIAGEIARFGRTVCLIDADPQGSAARWAEPHKLTFPVRREVLSYRREVIWVRDVLKTGSDFVVLDLPAGLNHVFETSVLIADLLVVPSGPSSLDLSSAQLTINKAREVRNAEVTRVPLKVVTVPNAGRPEA